MLTFILDNVVNQAIVIFFSCFTEKTTGYEPKYFTFEAYEMQWKLVLNILCDLYKVLVGYFDPNRFPFRVVGRLRSSQFGTGGTLYFARRIQS